ncbi:MAG: CDP-diacylglycerol--serine O-phosphatidyltransferase [Betaproteobacteria bacterium]|nr:CDP-diacylglycerol--serine O-phosphatidyltransferase [Betaproteobacteria bacterium]MBI3056863.1 CDP-diacylglycerol--serine O-phosphatidyltransferase [Betaproteobacteria bacterium]
MYEPREKWLGKGGRFRRRGIYWLPNLFTTVALFAGFFSIVQAMNGHFEQSALAIFVAMVFDGLDGRVARFTHTQSAFGAEYDSLADMVSFGVAPALVIYVWALKDFSSAQNIPLLGAWLTTKLGWVAAFIYCACAALRLARFNTNIDVVDKRFFQGLPSPAAAALVAGMVWAFNEYQVRGTEVKWLAWALTMFAGITMVTNLKYYSGKDINPRKSVSFPVVVAIALAVVALVAVSSTLPEMLFMLFLSYAASGYALAVWDRAGRKRRGEPPAAPPS